MVFSYIVCFLCMVNVVGVFVLINDYCDYDWLFLVDFSRNVFG